MKKYIAIIMLTTILLAGCATEQYKNCLEEIAKKECTNKGEAYTAHYFEGVTPAHFLCLSENREVKTIYYYTAEENSNCKSNNGGKNNEKNI